MSALDQISVARYWEDFADKLLKGAPEIQRTEMRRAFYAGSFSILSIMLHVVGSDVVDEEAGVKLLDRLHKECKAFAARVAGGNA